MLPTDAPLINLNFFSEFEKIQTKNKNSYISKIDGKIEPMFSFWSINSFEKLDRILNLNDGYKIMKFAEEIGFEYLSIKKEKVKVVNAYMRKLPVSLNYDQRKPSLIIKNKGIRSSSEFVETLSQIWFTQHEDQKFNIGFKTFF